MQVLESITWTVTPLVVGGIARFLHGQVSRRNIRWPFAVMALLSIGAYWWVQPTCGCLDDMQLIAALRLATVLNFAAFGVLLIVLLAATNRPRTAIDATLCGAIALLIQFLLLHTHDAGKMHWLSIAVTSLLVNAISWQMRNRLNPGVALGLNAFVAPAMYLIDEWMVTNVGVRNSIFRDGLAFLGVCFLVAGGWPYAISAWSFKRADARQRRVASP